MLTSIETQTRGHCAHRPPARATPAAADRRSRPASSHASAQQLAAAPSRRSASKSRSKAASPAAPSADKPLARPQTPAAAPAHSADCRAIRISAALFTAAQFDLRHDYHRPPKHSIALPHRLRPPHRIIRINLQCIIPQLPGNHAITYSSHSRLSQRIRMLRRSTKTTVPSFSASRALLRRRRSRQLNNIETARRQKLQRLAIPLNHARQKRPTIDIQRRPLQTHRRRLRRRHNPSRVPHLRWLWPQPRCPTGRTAAREQTSHWLEPPPQPLARRHHDAIHRQIISPNFRPAGIPRHQQDDRIDIRFFRINRRPGRRPHHAYLIGQAAAAPPPRAAPANSRAECKSIRAQSRSPARASAQSSDRGNTTRTATCTSGRLDIHPQPHLQFIEHRDPRDRANQKCRLPRRCRHNHSLKPRSLPRPALRNSWAKICAVQARSSTARPSPAH